MCDTVSPSIIFGVLALVPGTISRYVCLALAFVSFIFFAAGHQGLAEKLIQLEDVIEALEEILERAKTASSYARNHVEVIDAGCRLLQVKLSASKIQCNLLAMRSATWKIYLTNMRPILHSIDQCAKEVKEIHAAMLLIIEEERQRKLTEGIIESQEVLGTVARTVAPNPTPMSSKKPIVLFAACTYLLRYRFGSMSEANLSIRKPRRWYQKGRHLRSCYNSA
ncbi:hypothetical protein B0H13DRAFT_1881648 [Mycena leptocephala]|nr:hypothetical protein B0H13DRAFT_1881648 [Mycena leptocephala]